MHRRFAVLALLALALGEVASAQDYSADIVDLAKLGAPTLARI